MFPEKFTNFTKQFADLNKIHSSGCNLLELIHDILEISNIETGRVQIHPESFDLKKVVHEVTESIKPLLEKNHKMYAKITKNYAEIN